MNKNLNMKLISLLLVLCGLIVAMAVLYQFRFASISSNYNTKVETLEETSKNLEELQAKYQKAVTSLEISEKDIQFYDKIYVNTTSELQQKQGELQTKEQELASKSRDLQSTINELAASRNQVSSLNSEITSKQATLTQLSRTLHDMEQQRNNYKSRYNKFRDCYKSCNGGSLDGC